MQTTNLLECTECINSLGPNWGYDWVPRGFCGNWPTWLQTLAQINGFAIFGSYIGIGYLLFNTLLSVNKYYLDFNRLTTNAKRAILLWFGLVFAICGLGHLESWLAFHTPNYLLFTLWDTLTAVVSWTAVILSFKIRKQLLFKTEGFGRHSER